MSIFLLIIGPYSVHFRFYAVGANFAFSAAIAENELIFTFGSNKVFFFSNAILLLLFSEKSDNFVTKKLHQLGIESSRYSQAFFVFSALCLQKKNSCHFFWFASETKKSPVIVSYGPAYSLERSLGYSSQEHMVKTLAVGWKIFFLIFFSENHLFILTFHYQAGSTPWFWQNSETFIVLASMKWDNWEDFQEQIRNCWLWIQLFSLKICLCSIPQFFLR